MISNPDAAIFAAERELLELEPLVDTDAHIGRFLKLQASIRYAKGGIAGRCAGKAEAPCGFQLGT